MSKLARGVRLERGLMNLMDKNPRLKSFFQMSSDEDDTKHAIDLWADNKPVQIGTFSKTEAEDMEYFKGKALWTKARMGRLANQAQIVFIQADNPDETVAKKLLEFLFKNRNSGTYMVTDTEVRELS